MNKNRRNILIAVVLLVILLVMPFWGTIKGLITGEDASTGATTQTPQVACTLAVSVQPALEDLDLVKEEARELLPEDGWLLAETQVTLSEGSTLLDALQTACREAGLAVEASSGYVEAIGGLRAGDGGDLSGWTYTVNGETVMTGAGELEVQEGDQILWSYVCTWE